MKDQEPKERSAEGTDTVLVQTRVDPTMSKRIDDLAHSADRNRAQQIRRLLKKALALEEDAA